MIVKLVYAGVKRQKQYVLTFKTAPTIERVINQSGVLVDFPEIDLNTQKVGIYSDIKPLCYKVKDNDRIEIYRSLSVDPKDARRLRAEQKRKKDNIGLFGA